jgi:hypothetical protein
MEDWQRVLGVIAVVIAGVLVLRYFTKSYARTSTSAASGSGSGPAYLDTAADNSISVTGVPEESPCSEPQTGAAEGPASCS